MPRKPRFYLPEVPVHIVQRGHSRNPVFFETQDYATYAHWLEGGASKYRLAIHAFVLMTNHVHLLVTPEESSTISRFMQFVGRQYVPYMNNKYGRSGSIWEGRYKASLVQEERYFLTVMRYIEMNPVRAGLVDLPGHYRWSSFCHNVGVRSINLITPHAVYSSLGRCGSEQYSAYKALFHDHLNSSDMKRIRDAWQTGTPLGNDMFRDEIEQRLQCKVGVARRGRPTNPKSSK